VIRKQQMIEDKPDLVIVFPGYDLFTDMLLLPSIST
jgi:hypothetical protein